MRTTLNQRAGACTGTVKEQGRKQENCLYSFYVYVMHGSMETELLDMFRCFRREIQIQHGR